MKTSNISLYVDSLIAEIIISDAIIMVDGIIKTADEGMPVLPGVPTREISSFFTPKVDASKPGDSSGDSTGDNIVNFLGFIAPGVIFITFRRLGMPWVSWIGSILSSVFGVEIKEILSSIYTSIRDAISGGKKTTPEAVGGFVDNAFNNADRSTPTKSPNDLGQLLSSGSLNIKLRQAKLVKMAILERQDNLYAFALPELLSKMSFIGVVKSLFTTFFTTALAAGGFMLAGKAINSFIGKDSPSFDDKPVTNKGKRKKNTPGKSTKTDDITWVEPYGANEFDIADMLIDFAKEIYPGSIEKENIIRASTSFKNVVYEIVQSNSDHSGSGITIIPTNYKSKKEIVDKFIEYLPNVSTSNVSTSNNREYQPSNELPYKRKSPTSSFPTNAPVSTPTSYPIVISDKWKERMTDPRQTAMLSKLTPDEQKKVEAYLDSLGYMELFKINNMSEDEKVALFKQNVKEQLGNDAYNRVNSA